MVFPCKLEHAWKVVDLLVWFHFCNPLRQDSIIRPEYVPVVIWILVINITAFHLVHILVLKSQLVIVQVFGDEPYHKILAIAHIDNQSFLIFKSGVVSIIFDSNRLRKPPHFGCILLLFDLLVSLLPCIFGRNWFRRCCLLGLPRRIKAVIEPVSRVLV